jgi:hypothetical protein
MFQCREITVSLLDQLKSLFHRSHEPSATRRLDGRSKELLAASIKMIPYEECGWITIQEAAVLFSPADDEYAFREMDAGPRNLASFVAEETRRCRFAFREGRLYFMRTTSNLPDIRASFGGLAQPQEGLPFSSEAIRRMLGQVFNGPLLKHRIFHKEQRSLALISNEATAGFRIVGQSPGLASGRTGSKSS